MVSDPEVLLMGAGTPAERQSVPPGRHEMGGKEGSMTRAATETTNAGCSGPSSLFEARVDPRDRELAPAEDGDPAFAALRPRLFGIAHRVLGSSAEAEDVVQETWLRWQACDRSAVRNPAAFLGTTTTRLALNVTQSARSHRETSVGQWLPEPVDTHDDPALGAERSEALELAVLLLLERLRPRERAVYVLREAFGYPYARIAEMLQLTEAHARQLASRARKSLGAERRQSGGTPAPARCLLAAAGAGDRTPSRNDALSGPSWSDWRCASAPAFAEARTPTKPQHKIEGD